ncbi:MULTISPECIES: helix-turn-helix domain-containing protein [Myxococcaceae]|uniref:Helix-turn-helix domain-containing protein n=1 Tax=Corallococcus exiguus TaxID=83462 RepID=A0A7X4Y9U9_9BACT|nr:MULTISPECIES: helix-turn-helix transcriptional regulator [Myxococcaceae]MCP3169984.1 helix-turn-helix domain-containing protein [Myxococcus qinghaiensis]NBC41481.1 helix-turn-helix domain-containing protein [Corallococcus exiguus]NTX39143.1 helix-turn-helix transcriptional regulator [Myxococcus sp. CA033]TNV61698.1 helix-turn-helix transcriptional regulator [Corallococcus exiguus]
MNEQLATHLGAIARLAREQMSLTQVQVAERVGMASAVYSRIERGHMIPSVETLKKLCIELMVSPEDMMGLTESPDRGAPTRPEDDVTLRRLLFLARKLDAAKLDALVRITTELAR